MLPNSSDGITMPVNITSIATDSMPWRSSATTVCHRVAALRTPAASSVTTG